MRPNPRYLRMTTATGLIACALLAAALAVASARTRTMARPLSPPVNALGEGEGGEGGRVELRGGEDVWEEECSACHRPRSQSNLEAVRAFFTQRPREEAVDFLLQGPDGHPSFDALADEELASLLVFLGEEGAAPEAVRDRR